MKRFFGLIAVSALLAATPAGAFEDGVLRVWINGDKGYDGLQEVGNLFEEELGIPVIVEHPDDATAPLLGIRYWAVPAFGSMQEYFDTLRQRFGRTPWGDMSGFFDDMERRFERQLDPEHGSDAMPETDSMHESSDQKDPA